MAMVPLIEMTDDEIQREAKKQETKGNPEHANELRQFLGARQIVAEYLLRQTSPFQIRQKVEAWGPVSEFAEKWNSGGKG